MTSGNTGIFARGIPIRVKIRVKKKERSSVINQRLERSGKASLASCFDPFAESFEPYHSKKERLYPYYRIYVKNYTIYYVVIPAGTNEKIMEVRRILHNLQNRDDYL